MMNELIETVSKILPLSIDFISWDDPTLNFYGKEWSFATLSSWRIIDHDIFVCGCYDQEADTIIQQLKGLLIVSIQPQSTALPIDLTFSLSNGYKLEIFSTSYYEPWVFRVPSGLVYVASPSDPRYVM